MEIEGRAQPSRPVCSVGFLHHLTDPSSHLVKISFALFPYPHPSENGSAPQRGFGVPLRLKQLKREMPAVSQQGSLPGGITLQSFPGHQHLPGPHLREAPRSATSNQSLNPLFLQLEQQLGVSTSKQTNKKKNTFFSLISFPKALISKMLSL